MRRLKIEYVRYVSLSLDLEIGPKPTFGKNFLVNSFIMFCVRLQNDTQTALTALSEVTNGRETGAICDWSCSIWIDLIKSIDGPSVNMC